MSNALISKILAPVDLSSCSRAALEFACNLALPFAARVEVLFVLPPSATAAGTPLESAEELEAARAELHRFVTSVPGTSLAHLSERVECGDAGEKIIQVAKAGSFDAIALGTHGRTGRPRSLAGSVAESTVRRAPCPVITVREK